MSFRGLIDNVRRCIHPGRSGRALRGGRRHSFVPRLNVLEDRCVPALMPLKPMDNRMLVYDPNYTDVYGVQGATWLADADLAATKTFGVKGINPDGSMTWQTAMDWVAAMNNADYLGHSNWTLPLTPDNDPNATIHNVKNDADFGFNFYSGAMGELFYDEFHGVAGESITSIDNKNTEMFNNFQPYLYWGGFWPDSNRPQDLPVSFTFDNGFLGTTAKDDFLYAIPEFPSDPLDVPKPHLPPANNVIPIQVFNTVPSLVPSADGKIIHDDKLNINWLADADLAATKHFGLPVDTNTDPTAININPDGSMNYLTALRWIDAMNAADYLGHNNWRLPDSSADPDTGYYENDSEMGELYYTELGGQAGGTILDTDDPFFSNFRPELYWSETANNSTSGNDGHKTFSFGSGYQGGNYDADQWYVIPVFDSDVQTVTNNNDHGPGSLRAAVAAAHSGDDTIEFSPGLADKTITLQSPIDIDKPLDIVWSGANQPAISGDNATRIFNIEPIAMGVDGGVAIVGLTLEDGLADEGGAILDDGASLTLMSDTFSSDKAEGAFAGDAAMGGALAVGGKSAQFMNVTILDCQFRSDTATGAAPTVQVGSTEQTGGDGEGGAIYVDGGSAKGFQFFVSGSTFADDSATGGDGPTDSGLSGGDARGGAIFFTSDAAANPLTLSVTDSVFSSNSAIGGAGAGGLAALQIGPISYPGLGGDGGMAMGGAVYVDFTSSSGSTDLFTKDQFLSNEAKGGHGGRGGLFGGSGGNGGAAEGGGLALVGGANAGRIQLTVAHSTIAGNTAQAGDGGGGSGESADNGGSGGDGAGASGGGLYLRSSSPSNDTWTLDHDAIKENNATSGDGGHGGKGDFVSNGGNGGDSDDSFGAGVYDAFQGTLDLLHCDTVSNTVLDGEGGSGGSGTLTDGHAGRDSESFGGGLYVTRSATAEVDGDTRIRDNQADNGPDVYGTI